PPPGNYASARGSGNTVLDGSQPDMVNRRIPHLQEECAMAADMSLHAAGAARRGGNVPRRRRREPLLLPDRPVGDLLERERRSAFLRLGPLTPDIEFLVRRGIPPALLSMASRLATLH